MKWTVTNWLVSDSTASTGDGPAGRRAAAALSTSRLRGVFIVAGLLLSGVLPASAQSPSFLTFESGQVRPLALSPNGLQLFAVNTPDNQLEIFDVGGGGALTRAGVVQVGMEPVAVAARTNGEVWVVNHLSDSVSVVDLSGPAPRVIRTLLVGDEPNDIVFAGPGGNRAFITTAHRGQNSSFPRSEYDVPGVGRADVWVFDATDLGAGLGGDPDAVITLFADKPRALAVSPDGTRVYAAAFRSGNQTATVIENFVCDTSSARMNNNTVEPACSVNGVASPGGYPPPHKNQQNINRPETGLIVKLNRDGGTSDDWQDELGRNWNNVVRFSLPDRDVFEIDANATPPAAIDASNTCADGAGCWAGVGTILFNMAVNPVSGKIYVSNTDAQNDVRFEGPGIEASGVKPPGEPTTVQGDLARSQITVLNGANVDPRHLNKHIDYAIRPAPAGVKSDSLATPVGMALSSDGATLYVAAFGSSKVGVFNTSQLENNTFTPDANDHIQLAGGGPSGLVLSGNRLYVLTRFDNTVRVINTSTRSQLQAISLHNPEPAIVVTGRPFLYDAVLTSSNGEASCSSCHIFGDMDDLSWDLGNPDDDQVDNDNDFNPVIPPFFDPLPRVFHPMKGPMTTQSLRGLEHMGPEHWRGDRQGDGTPGNDGDDEILAFEAFNVAFPGLVGRNGELTPAQMTAFRRFVMEIRYPPNPIRQLNNALRTDEQDGLNLYNGRITDTAANCEGCHALSPAQGFFGGDGQATFEGETQHFKVPHLRNAYQKIGMFGLAPGAHQGDQVRGSGFLHDGSIDTVFSFLSAGVFSINDAEQDDLEAFIMAFPTDLAPIVGQQITRTSANGTVANPRVNLLIQRADATFVSRVLGGTVTECELIAKGIISNVQRGALYLGGNQWQSDRLSEPQLSTTTLLGLVQPGQEITFTCVPPGSGLRMAIDRDEDGFLDRDEIDAGSNPADPQSTPGGTTTTTTASTTTTTTLIGPTTTTTVVATTTTTTTTVGPTTTTTVASTTTTTVVVTTTTSAPTTTTTLQPPGATVNIRSTSLILKDDDSAINLNKRKIRFTSRTNADAGANRVIPPLPGSAGDPTLHGATLIVYNSNGSGQVVTVGLDAAYWDVAATGVYRYRGPDEDGPVKTITVLTDKITIKGGKAGWDYTLDEPAQGRVAVRLALGAGVQWCADAPAKSSGTPPSTAKFDKVDKFIGAKNTPPPAICAAVPSGSPSGGFLEEAATLF